MLLEEANRVKARILVEEGHDMTEHGNFTILDDDAKLDSFLLKSLAVFDRDDKILVAVKNVERRIVG